MTYGLFQFLLKAEADYTAKDIIGGIGKCGKELDSVGLKGHRYYAHQIPYQSANLAANTDSPNVHKEAKWDISSMRIIVKPY